MGIVAFGAIAVGGGPLRWCRLWGGGIPAAPAVDSRVGVDWVRQFSRASLRVVRVPLRVVRRETVVPRWV